MSLYSLIYWYAKANDKYMKGYESYDWTMPQKLSVCNLEWIKDTSLFNEDFIKKI